eukprot:4434447-Alexandrium_andersonii.AAC.1
MPGGNPPHPLHSELARGCAAGSGHKRPLHPFYRSFPGRAAQARGAEKDVRGGGRAQMQFGPVELGQLPRCRNKGAIAAGA